MKDVAFVANVEAPGTSLAILVAYSLPESERPSRRPALESSEVDTIVDNRQNSGNCATGSKEASVPGTIFSSAPFFLEHQSTTTFKQAASR